MRRPRFLFALLITAAIVVVFSSMSRMAFFRASIVDGAHDGQADASLASSDTEQPLRQPLEDSQIVIAQYSIADPSVRSALARIGRRFTLTFDQDGIYRASAQGRGVSAASIDLLRRTDADINADGQLDVLLPLTVHIAGQKFVELAVLLNRDGVAEYAGGYPLGNRAEFHGATQQPDGGIRIAFQYSQDADSAPVDAAMVVHIQNNDSAANTR